MVPPIVAVATSIRPQQASPAQTGQHSKESTLGKEDFLTLLIAQLKNQNPLRPMDDKDFIAQLAQFNSLEQLQVLNQGMEALLELQQLGQASTLVGKSIIARLDGSGRTVEGTVSSVRMSGGVAELLVGTELVHLWEVTEVRS